MKRKSESAEDPSGRRKRPCSASINRTRPQFRRNLVPRSWLTKEDVRRVVREELERAERSHSAEYCQSCTGNGLRDVVRSLGNAVQKLEEAVERKNSHGIKQEEAVERENSHGIKQEEAVEPKNSHSLHRRRNDCPTYTTSPQQQAVRAQ